MRSATRRRDEEGQALTEFVIWMFVLLLMMGGIMHFGRAYLLQQQCVLSSRYMAYKSARFSENQLSYAQIENRGKYFYSFPGSEDSEITMTPDATPAPGGLGADSPGLDGFSSIMNMASDQVAWTTTAKYVEGPFPNGFMGVTLQPTLRGMSSVPGGTWNNRNMMTGGDTVIGLYSVAIGAIWARHYF